MKNKIFELYKPKSLDEFLIFKKENPEETFVYVLQHPPENINILSASNFGYLVICLPQLSQIVFSTGPFVFKMRKNLQDFRAQDYILLTGDPAVIGISCAIVVTSTLSKRSLDSFNISSVMLNFMFCFKFIFHINPCAFRARTRTKAKAPHLHGNCRFLGCRTGNSA